MSGTVRSLAPEHISGTTSKSDAYGDGDAESVSANDVMEPTSLLVCDKNGYFTMRLTISENSSPFACYGFVADALNS